MGARNRVSIGLALCAVLTGGVLVAGCSAAPAETYETPYYTLQLPTDLAASCVIEYDDYARMMNDGSARSAIRRACSIGRRALHCSSSCAARIRSGPTRATRGA